MMNDKELLELAAKAAGIVEDLRGGRDDVRLGLIRRKTFIQHRYGTPSPIMAMRCGWR